MSKRNYSAEQIISKLREVEVKIRQGLKASEAIRALKSANRHITAGEKNTVG